MLADRLQDYASASQAGMRSQHQAATLAITSLAAPISHALRLAATVRMTEAIEALAQGEPSVLHAALCHAKLPECLVWVEVPAEEKERVRETLLAARGLPLAAPVAGAPHAITLGYLVAPEGDTQKLAISLVVELIDPDHGPSLAAASTELVLDLPAEPMPPDVSGDAEACLDDLEGRLSLRASQWCRANAAPNADAERGGDYGDLLSEALTICALVAVLGDGQRHSIRAPGSADGMRTAGLDFDILDLP